MMQSTSTTSTNGLVVYGIGAALMLVLGFAASWWYVPAIRAAGMNELSAPGGLTFLWSISAPLGALLVVIGGGLYARAEGRTIALLIVGSLILIAVTALWPVRQVIPALFGIDGGLITLFFLGLVWHWARSRPVLSESEQLSSDLHMAGHVFFVVAAWYLCGLLGAPTFALRPKLMDEYGTLSSAASLGTMISVYLAIGWGFTYAGQRVALRAKSDNTGSS
jgi:hypothetical protein